MPGCLSASILVSSQVFNTESWPDILPLRITHNLVLKVLKKVEALKRVLLQHERVVWVFLYFSLLKRRIFLQFLACINHASVFPLLGFKQTQK